MTNTVHLIVGITFCALYLFVGQGSALSCFECNSHNDSRCADKMPPEQLKMLCPTGGAHEFTLCRKIIQIIEFEVNGLPPDSRVIRTCGWDDSTYKNRCYQRSGFGGRQEVCACETDFCNNAPSISATVMPIALAVTALYKIFM